MGSYFVFRCKLIMTKGELNLPSAIFVESLSLSRSLPLSVNPSSWIFHKPDLPHFEWMSTGMVDTLLWSPGKADRDSAVKCSAPGSYTLRQRLFEWLLSLAGKDVFVAVPLVLHQHPRL